jgi:hypothetical protein
LTALELQESAEPKNNFCTYTEFTGRLRNLHLNYHLEAIDACVRNHDMTCRCVSTNIHRPIPTFYVTLVIKKIKSLRKL